MSSRQSLVDSILFAFVFSCKIYDMVVYLDAILD